jgi:hypothetical protein
VIPVEKIVNVDVKLSPEQMWLQWQQLIGARVNEVLAGPSKDAIPELLGIGINVLAAMTVQLATLSISVQEPQPVDEPAQDAQEVKDIGVVQPGEYKFCVVAHPEYPKIVCMDKYGHEGDHGSIIPNLRWPRSMNEDAVR